METGGTFGRYTVLATLGEPSDDAMVAQWAAQAGFARLVVIKSLFPESQRRQLSDHLEATRRAASLQHPNVRQIHELGAAEGRTYLAVEYLEGVTYDQLLRGRNRSETLSDPRLHAALLAQACEGLHHAHTRPKLLHNALRPNRLFVTSGGTVKVLGLGLGPLQAATADSATLASANHYAYMSPEQILGRPVDPRSDVFSMGILAWEALTGRRLFARSSRIEVYRAITDQPIPRPGRLARGLPPRIDAAVSRALALSPNDRFRSTREFGLALEEGVTELGAPLSTVAIASCVDRWFSRELETQRTVIQRARQVLTDGDSEEDVFDVPTSLFSGGFDPIQPTEQINPDDLAKILAETANESGGNKHAATPAFEAKLREPKAPSPHEPMQLDREPMRPPAPEPVSAPRYEPAALDPPSAGFGAPQPAPAPKAAFDPMQAAPPSAFDGPEPARASAFSAPGRTAAGTAAEGPPPSPQARAGFARPPETLSDVSNVADVQAALADDFEPVPSAPPPPPTAVAEEVPSVKPATRGWLVAMVLLLLIGAAAASGYYYWQVSQEKPPAPVSIDEAPQ